MARSRNHDEHLRTRDRRIWLAILAIGVGLLALASHLFSWDWQKILWAIFVWATLSGAIGLLGLIGYQTPPTAETFEPDDKADT